MTTSFLPQDVSFNSDLRRSFNHALNKGITLKQSKNNFLTSYVQLPLGIAYIALIDLFVCYFVGIMKFLLYPLKDVSRF